MIRGCLSNCLSSLSGIETGVIGSIQHNKSQTHHIQPLLTMSKLNLYGTFWTVSTVQHTDWGPSVQQMSLSLWFRTSNNHDLWPFKLKKLHTTCYYNPKYVRTNSGFISFFPVACHYSWGFRLLMTLIFDFLSWKNGTPVLTGKCSHRFWFSRFFLFSCKEACMRQIIRWLIRLYDGCVIHPNNV